MHGIKNTLFKLRIGLRGLPRDAGWCLGLNRSFIANAKGARILAYHGICSGDQLKFNTLFTRLKRFESQLRFYKKYFNVISLNDFYEQRFSHNQFNICLTFDDGFANNYKYVLPLLEQFQVPATFFVTAIRDVDYDILWNDFLGIVSKYGSDQITFKNEIYQKGIYNKYFSTKTGISLVERLRS